MRAFENLVLDRTWIFLIPPKPNIPAEKICRIFCQSRTKLNIPYIAEYSPYNQKRTAKYSARLSMPICYTSASHSPNGLYIYLYMQFSIFKIWKLLSNELFLVHKYSHCKENCRFITHTYNWTHFTSIGLIQLMMHNGQMIPPYSSAIYSVRNNDWSSTTKIALSIWL